MYYRDRDEAFLLPRGISPPARGGLPPRRFIILSKALKSARALRSAKNFAVCKAESFSATAVATNWFMLVLSSLLCPATALFSERGNRKGYVIVSVIFSSSDCLPRGHYFDSEPSRPCPEVARIECNQRIGSPINSRLEHQLMPGSRSCGRHRKCVFYGSAIAMTASRNISTSRSFKPAAPRCSASEQIASYSMAQGDADQQSYLALPGCPQNRSRCTTGTAHRCYDHIRIGNFSSRMMSHCRRYYTHECGEPGLKGAEAPNVSPRVGKSLENRTVI